MRKNVKESEFEAVMGSLRNDLNDYYSEISYLKKKLALFERTIECMASYIEKDNYWNVSANQNGKPISVECATFNQVLNSVYWLSMDDAKVEVKRKENDKLGCDNSDNNS